MELDTWDHHAAITELAAALAVAAIPPPARPTDFRARFQCSFIEHTGEPVPTQKQWNREYVDITENYVSAKDHPHATASHNVIFTVHFNHLDMKRRVELTGHTNGIYMMLVCDNNCPVFVNMKFWESDAVYPDVLAKIISAGRTDCSIDGYAHSHIYTYTIPGRLSSLPYKPRYQINATATAIKMKTAIIMTQLEVTVPFEIYQEWVSTIKK